MIFDTGIFLCSSYKMQINLLYLLKSPALSAAGKKEKIKWVQNGVIKVKIKFLLFMVLFCLFCTITKVLLLCLHYYGSTRYNVWNKIPFCQNTSITDPRSKDCSGTSNNLKPSKNSTRGAYSQELPVSSSLTSCSSSVQFILTSKSLCNFLIVDFTIWPQFFPMLVCTCLCIETSLLFLP